MAVVGINTKCFILALFIRDDNERFLLGDGYYEFKNDLKHFQANTIVNDVVEVQGNDGYLLAGQVRRSGTQEFNGYIADGTVSKTTTEDHRRQFFSFFRKNHFYKVVYVMPDGSAIQRKRGFLVDDPTVSEMYQQYPEYHVALNFEDINYYVYNEDSEGHEIYGKSAVIGLIQGLSGGLIWDALGAVSDGFTWVNPVNVSGANITIDNQLGAMVPIEDLELKGDTSQASSPTPDAPQAINVVTGEQTIRRGKNMYDYTTLSLTSSCVATDYGFERTLTSTTPLGTFYSNAIYNPIGTFTVSFEARIANADTATLLFSQNAYIWGKGSLPLKDADGNVSDNTYRTLGSEWKKFSFTVTTTEQLQWSAGRAMHLYFSTVTNSPELEVQKFQIEVGSTATAYEPYTYQHYTVNLGKNLLDVTQISLPSKATGEITAGKIDIQSWTSGSLQLDIPFEAPAGTYTFSYHFSAPNGYDFYGNILNASGTNIGAIGPQSSTTSAIDTDMTKTATITEASSLIRMVFYNPARAPLVLSNIQLERGFTATPYTPYFTPIELAKVGTYQDYIYKSGDDWYVHKTTKKVVFNGTEEWDKPQADNVFRLSGDYSDMVGASIANVGISDHFVYWANTGGILNNLPNGQFGFVGALTSINFRNDSTTSSTAFKTWLQSNNTTVYYALATPTDTQITDATLISQLEALGAMRLYIGENNLSVSSASLPAILDFDYYSGIDYSGAGYEWEDGGTGGPETITVDSIDNVYPVWTVTGPALNPQLSVLTTNTTTTYAGTVAVGQTLVIDMFNKTATLNGTSVIGNVAGDWANFKPGNNRVIYSTNNADAPASKIEWQEVVG